MPAAPPDPSTFFRVNEELALELARLERAGHLDRVLELLRDMGGELWVSAVKPRDGLEEMIGRLAPRLGALEDDPPAALGLTPREAAESPAGACGGGGCGAPAASAPSPLAARGGWDHEGVLALRSRFSITLPDGTAREVYMPDHLCPSCWNEEQNQLRSCARVCAQCGFEW